MDSITKDAKQEIVKSTSQTEEEQIEIAPLGKAKEKNEEEIDPLVLEFLDADSYEEKLNILTALHHRITNQMINTMAVASDLEIPDMELEERYDQLRRCLMTKDRFEIKRY